MKAFVITMSIICALSAGVTLKSTESDPVVQVLSFMTAAGLAAWGFYLLFS